MSPNQERPDTGSPRPGASPSRKGALPHSQPYPGDRRNGDDRRICFDRREMIRFDADRRQLFDRRLDGDPFGPAIG